MLALLPLVLAIAPDPKVDPFAKWEKEIAGIEKRLTDAKPAAGGVLFYGSSSIRLWDLKKSFPDAAYLNAGFGGSTIRDCTHFVPRLVSPFAPKTIVFYAGDNDIAGGRTAEQVAADFQAFRDVVKKDLPKTRILYIPVKPSVARRAKLDVQKKANALVKAICDADTALGYVDIVPGMLGANGEPTPDLFVKDGLHLSAAGYEQWTKLVAAALATAKP